MLCNFGISRVSSVIFLCCSFFVRCLYFLIASIVVSRCTVAYLAYCFGFMCYVSFVLMLAFLSDNMITSLGKKERVDLPFSVFLFFLFVFFLFFF